MNTQAMTDSERALATSTARLLQAGAVAGGALGLGCAAAAVLALLSHLPPAAAALAAFVLALAPLERVLTLRLRFDAGLFQDLARTGGPLPDALAALDQALAALRLRTPAAVPRPLPDRTQGARRLLRWHLLCVATQFGALAALLLLRGLP